MVNSHVRLANGIMRFARKLAYGLVARSRSMRIAADEDIKRKSPATHGETINELGHGDWEKGRDLRWSELNQQRLDKDISPTALMEFMLLGSGLEGLLFNVAQKVKAKLGVEVAKLEDQMNGVEKSDWELDESADTAAQLKLYDKEVEKARLSVEKRQNELDEAEKSLKQCEADIKALESKDDLSDNDEDTLEDLKDEREDLLNSLSEIRGKLSYSKEHLESRERGRKKFLEVFGGTNQERLAEVKRRFDEFSNFVSNESTAKGIIFDYLMSKADIIFRNVSTVKVPALTEPEDLMHNMAASLLKSLSGLETEQFANKVLDGISTNMALLARGGTGKGFSSVAQFLKFCGAYMKDAATRAIQTSVRLPQTLAPIKNDDDEFDETSWEDVTEDKSSRNPIDYESHQSTDALMTWLGEGYDEKHRRETESDSKRDVARRDKLIEAVKAAGNVMFENQPLELEVFKQYMKNADFNDVVNSRSFDLSKDFYTNLFTKAMSNSTALDSLRQKRLTEDESAVLNEFSYSEIMSNPEIPDSFKARLIEKDGKPILLKSMSALKYLVSTEIVPAVRDKMPEIIFNAVQGLASSRGGGYEELSGIVNYDDLKKALQEFFSDMSREKKDSYIEKLRRKSWGMRKKREQDKQKKEVQSSLDIGAELMRVAELLRGL